MYRLIRVHLYNLLNYIHVLMYLHILLTRVVKNVGVYCMKGKTNITHVSLQLEKDSFTTPSPAENTST